MKKLIPALIVLLVSTGLSAQYKKASFFAKSGRTYELATHLYALGDGKGSPIGFGLGFGKDQDGKQLFRSGEWQFIPSYKYSFLTTTINNNTPVTISGTTKSSFIYALNYGYYLLSNEEGDERKIKPFVGAGLNIILVTRAKTEIHTPEEYDTRRQIYDDAFNIGVNGGAGCMVNFTPKFALKLQAGYGHQFHLSNKGSDEEAYYMFNSHPYVSVGLRLRVVED